MNTDNKLIRAYKHFNSYNEKRYSKPWIALIIEWDTGKKPVMQFGEYVGEHGYEGEVEILASIGSVVRYGRKDYRGNNTINQFAVVNKDGTLTDITPVEAKKLFNKV